MSLEHPRFDTLQAHAGQSPDPATGARAVPIYQTTSYTFGSVEYAADLFALKQDGFIYSRISNPTVDVFEKRLAALEGGTAAVAYASGMAAIFGAILNLASAGDEVVAARSLYGGTHTLFADRLPGQYGIGVKLVDIDDLAELEGAITDRTRAVYIETVGNPRINIPDFEGVARVAHAHGLPVVCDNTFGTPYLFRAGEWGIDVVVHSVTKYIGGHGTSVGGALVDMGSFVWKGNPRFPGFNLPDESYHGVVYADLNPTAFAAKARSQGMRDLGACMSPFNAFLLLMGLETLSLRVERHCRNAEKLAAYLNAHPRVRWVNYPALPGDEYHERMLKYLPKGVGGIFTFGIEGGKQAGARFIEKLRIFSHLANVADAKSLVIHPASTTHSQMDEESLRLAGISADMIRISTGLEDIDDLIEDLGQALE